MRWLRSCVTRLKEMQEVRQLHSIRDNEKKINRIFSVILQRQELKLPIVLKKGQPLCLSGWEMETTKMAKAGSL